MGLEMSEEQEVKELTAQEKLEIPLPAREPSKNVLEEKVKSMVEELDNQDKTALFFNMYGHKLHSYMENMSVKQMRRAYMNSLGNKDPKYSPRTQEEKFVSWATDKLVELKMTMQMHLMYEKLGEAQGEYEKNSGLEETIIKGELERSKTEALPQEKEESNG